jgi:hypothetical protein
MRSLPTGGPPVRRGFALIGIAANARFAGLAVTIDGAPVHWRVTRFRQERDARSQAAVSSLLTAVLRRFDAAAIVLLVDDSTDDRLARARRVVRDAVAPVISATALPTLEVKRTDLARDLGLSRSTNLALRRELLRRTPLRDIRSREYVTDARESERYWECAVLASGATQVPLRHAKIVHA